MKQFQGSNKQFKPNNIFTALFILFFGILFIPLLFSNAQNIEEIKSKIDQKNLDISKLEAEINSFQNQLNNLSKQKSSLNGSLEQLEITRKKLSANIALTESKIEKTNLKIQSLNSEINTKDNFISNDQASIALGLRQMNEFELNTLTETLLSKEDLTSIWNDINGMIEVHDSIRGKIISLKQVKGELEDTREETFDAKNELTRLKNELADEKKIVEQNKLEKNKLLKQTKNNEANYQKLLKDGLLKKEALEQELRNYESQLKFVLDPSKLPSGGVLSWPLDDVYITQLFGKTVAAKRLYASGSHSGVDFRASVGTPVKAMADGVILGTGDTDATCPGASFGKWILLEYDNGLSSAYGHLSLSKVNSGQKVVRGEIVGYSGSTGHVTGPHLHVTVYASNSVKVQTLPSKSCAGKTLTQPLAAVNAYLDPMYYLPVYKK
jgi:murein DD-endopeptidase MepM/ murein hydrolase activator NlpD